MTFYKENISEAHRRGSDLVKFSDDANEAFNKRIIFYLGFFTMTFTMSQFCMELALSLVLLGVILVDMLCYGYITYEDCKQAASELNRLQVLYGHLQTGGNNLVNLIRGTAPTSSESSSQPQAPTSSGSSSQQPNQGILVNLESYPKFQTLGSFSEIVSQPLPYRMKSKWENIVNAVMPALIFLVLYVIISIIRSYVCEKGVSTCWD